jgi:hypothetical protein
MIEISPAPPNNDLKKDEETGAKAGDVAAPTCISGYYSENKVKAPRFIKALEAAKLNRFERADVEQALRVIDGTDTALDRTIALIVAARKSESRSISTAIIEWLGHLVEHQANQIGLADELGQSVADVPPERLIPPLLRVVRPILEGKASEGRTRATTLVRLLLTYIGARGTADPLHITRLVCRGMETGKSSRTMKADELRSRALGLLIAADLRILGQALALADLGEAMLAEANEHAARSRDDAAVQRKRAQSLSTSLEAAEQQIADLRAQLAATKAAAEEFKRDAQDHRLIGANMDQQNRGRMAGFLRDQLLPMLEQAHEAAELTPPRPDILQSLIGSLQNEARKQIKWLTASSA